MASLTTDKAGNRNIRFADPAGVRKCLYLGKMSKKACEQIKAHVEKLVSAAISKCSVADEVAKWVGGLDDTMRGKLARLGLIAAQQSATLESLVDKYIGGRNDAKESTKTVWRRTKRHLLRHFGGSCSLRSITKPAAKEFRQYLIGAGMAENTVRRTCGVAKQFFADALERELVATNVFKQKDIPTSTGGNKERQFYITSELARQVLDACPSNEWRLIFALSRFAGLRCPSEHVLLRWGDINWSTKRMFVRSPKTAHHKGGESRIVPIIPELQQYLDIAYEMAEPGEEFVIRKYRDARVNVRKPLEDILAKAGLKQWPKLYHNLRASCETDLAKVCTIAAVTNWLGNSVGVAQEHYLMVTEDQFERVTNSCYQNPCQSASDNDRKGLPTVSRRKENHWKPSVSPSRSMGDEGLEPTTSTV